MRPGANTPKPSKPEVCARRLRGPDRSPIRADCIGPRRMAAEPAVRWTGCRASRRAGTASPASAHPPDTAGRRRAAARGRRACPRGREPCPRGSVGQRDGVAPGAERREPGPCPHGATHRQVLRPGHSTATARAAHGRWSGISAAAAAPRVGRPARRPDVPRPPRPRPGGPSARRSCGSPRASPCCRPGPP